jgi:hypothetical protein
MGDIVDVDPEPRLPAIPGADTGERGHPPAGIPFLPKYPSCDRSGIVITAPDFDRHSLSLGLPHVGNLDSGVLRTHPDSELLRSGLDRLIRRRLPECSVENAHWLNSITRRYTAKIACFSPG